LPEAAIRAVKDSGLDLYFCCEPIGPEHSSGELVEQLSVGIAFGCFQHAAMRRVSVPGAALASRGQITELRLGQATLVLSLACIACPETRSIPVHEPNLIGLTSGANAIYAEAGANPWDGAKRYVGASRPRRERLPDNALRGRIRVSRFPYGGKERSPVLDSSAVQTHSIKRY
jgi:hypothetical protein